MMTPKTAKILSRGGLAAFVYSCALALSPFFSPSNLAAFVRLLFRPKTAKCPSLGKWRPSEHCDLLGDAPERGLSIVDLARAARRWGVNPHVQGHSDSRRGREKAPRQRELFETTMARRPPPSTDRSSGDA